METSSELYSLQPGPAELGYSQLRSTPAKLYLVMYSIFHLIKFARPSEDATIELYMVPPVQPPLLIMTLVPAAFANLTRV